MRIKDIYLYDNSDILINKLNIYDAKRLADADYVSMRLRELAEYPLKGHYDTEHFFQMHHYIFQDIYDWAGTPRKLNIKKSEDVLGGMSVEYSDVIDIVKDTRYCLIKANEIEWNTRTTITFMCQYADMKIKSIDWRLFEENSAYVRTALVAYNAYFKDGSNFQKKNYLEDVVNDALFGWNLLLGLLFYKKCGIIIM